MATKPSGGLNSTVHLCITGFSNIRTLPDDIVRSIAAYYSLGLGVNTFLFLKDVDGVHLYHIASQQSSLLTVCYDSPIDSRNFHPKMGHIVHGVSLPHHFRRKYKSNFLRRHICSDQWSFGFSVHLQCYLIAFHRDFMDSKNCTAYGFRLPDFISLRTSNIPSTVYSQRDETLYAMNFTDYSTNSDNNRIVALPMRNNPMKYQDNENHENSNIDWKRLDSELLYRRESTSVCMVDGDRFIGIFGGRGSTKADGRTTNKAELFAVNCNKSIPLKAMHRDRVNAISAYNEDIYKIVIAGPMCLTDGMEFYDINKDQWSLKPIKMKGRVQDMFLSENNPNIVHVKARGDAKQKLVHVDLRTNKQTFHELDDVTLIQNYFGGMPFLRL